MLPRVCGVIWNLLLKLSILSRLILSFFLVVSAWLAASRVIGLLREWWYPERRAEWLIMQPDKLWIYVLSILTIDTMIRSYGVCVPPLLSGRGGVVKADDAESGNTPLQYLYPVSIFFCFITWQAGTMWL